MKVVNLMKHEINLIHSDGRKETFPPSGDIARVDTLPQHEIEGLPFPCLTPTQFGEVVGLPEPQEGVLFLVSGFVADKVRRKDVFSPGTAPKNNPIRNDRGHVAAVRTFVRSA